jgi:tRNA(Arg) A34 adenosine deaminase TadA
MRRAIALAREGSAAGHGGPFGCVIVKDGAIVGEGYNQVLSSRDPTAHGEMVAIRAAAQRLGTHDLGGCEMYNINVPCPMCMAATFWARIGKLYYVCKPEDAAAIGFDNVRIDRELALPLAERELASQEMPDLYAEARAVYDAWFAARRRSY